MKWFALLLLGIGCACAVPGRLGAQDALVLGGGGARGLAHAGVLVGLERLGHDPEIVVGTSMGAIVGALYAAGYDPDAIWRLIETEDWPALFTPDPVLAGPERQVRYPLFRLGLDEAPEGLIPAWRINRRLVQLLFDAQARTRGDFDRLPRQFRAVAASLRDGRAVVLGTGDLARAVRASMAVPGVFAPVERDEDLLVDGGIRNNLPVSVARALGADRVTAVDVIRPPPEIEELDPLSTGLRGLRLLIQNAVPPGSAPDRLILPRIPAEVSEAVFPRNARPLLDAGLEAALREGGPARAGPPLPRPLPPPPESIGTPVVRSSDPGLTRLVRHAFHTVAPGGYDPEAVARAVDRLYATGLVTGVWPSLDPDTAQDPRGPDVASQMAAPRMRIQAEAVERSTVLGAVGYDNDRGGRAWASFTHRPYVAAPAELGVAGSVHRLERWASVHARRYPLWAIPLAWSVGAHYRESVVRRFRGDAVAGETEVHRAGGWAGAELRRLDPEAVLVAVIRAEHVDVEGGRAGAAVGPLLRFAATPPPTRVVGLPLLLEAEARSGGLDYGRARASGSVRGARGALLLAAVADLSVASNGAPPDVLPALGDEGLVPGLRWGERRARARAVVGGDIAWPIPFEGFVRVRARAGFAADDLDALGRSGAWTTGVEAGAIWTTPLGPLRAAVGANTEGRWRFDLSVGPEF